MEDLCCRSSKKLSRVRKRLSITIILNKLSSLVADKILFASRSFRLATHVPSRHILRLAWFTAMHSIHASFQTHALLGRSFWRDGYYILAATSRLLCVVGVDSKKHFMCGFCACMVSSLLKGGRWLEKCVLFYLKLLCTYLPIKIQTTIQIKKELIS